MALTKIRKEGITGISNASDASAIRMSIDSAGVVSKPVQPSFWISDTAASGYNTIADGGTIVFSAVKHNVGSHYSTSTGRFTAPVAGTYLFSATTYGDKTGGLRWTIRKNGSQYASGGGNNDCVPHGFQDGVFTSICTVVLQLAANDYVSCMTRVGFSVSVYGGHSYFSGVLVG